MSYEPGVFIQRLDSIFAKKPVFVLGRSESEFALILSPFLPLYYEGKVKKTIFSQDFVYVLRTTRTRHMVSFIDFYFHFLANFQT